MFLVILMSVCLWKKFETGQLWVPLNNRKWITILHVEFWQPTSFQIPVKIYPYCFLKNGFKANYYRIYHLIVILWGVMHPILVTTLILLFCTGLFDPNRILFRCNMNTYHKMFMVFTDFTGYFVDLSTIPEAFYLVISV